MRKTGFLFIILSLLYRPLTGQVYFHHFNSSNGLSDNSIFSIVQDDLGYLWLGTLNGLNRFDGQTFRVYKPIPGNAGTISNNIIEILAPGKNGNIWVQTRYGGLNHYRADIDQFVVYPDSLLPPPIHNMTGMTETPEGNLLMAMSGELYLFNPAQKRYKRLLPDVNVYAFRAFNDQEVLMRHEKGLSLYNIAELSTSQSPKALLNIGGKIRSFTTFSEKVFYTTAEGLFQYTPQYQASELIFSLEGKTEDNVKNEAITDIQYDGENFWLIVQNRLYNISAEKDHTFHLTRHEADPNRKGSLNSEVASFLFTDQLHNTWIVTSKTGVNVYNKNKNRFNYFFIPQNFNNENYSDPVRVIFPISAKNILVAFDHSGMGYIEEVSGEHVFKRLDVPELGQNSFIRAINKDSEGNIWIGSIHGLLIYNAVQKKITKAKEHYNLPDYPNCRVIRELKKGELLLGGSGLLALNLKTGKSRDLLKDLKTKISLSQVRDVVPDDNGGYWIGTDNSGLFKIDSSASSWERISQNTSPLRISNNKVYCLLKTPGKLWVGTHNGLNIIDQQHHKIHTLFEKNGLTDNVIYGLVADEAGYIWVSSSRGLNRVQINTLEVSSYLHDFYFMDDAYIKGTDQTIYFGGYDGFISFTPGRFIIENRVPKPILNSFRLFNQQVDINTLIQGHPILKKPIFQTDTITLDHTNRTFSLTFDAVPVLTPDVVQYRYKLEGYDDRWIYTTGQERQASFTNVPPGNYTLIIQTSLPYSNWSDGKQVCIIITPPYWETAWFKLLMGFLAISLLASLYYYRLNRIKKMNLYLQKQVEEQTFQLKEQNKEILNQKNEMEMISKRLHEADQLKLNIFTTISHEFRTPLTLILGHLEMLLEKRNKNPHSSLNIIKSNAKSLLNLVNQLIEIRKNDQQKNTLQISKFHLADFCNMILQAFQPLARKKNITLSLISTMDTPTVWLDQVKTEHIINNLLSNAIKYTPENGEIELLLEEDEETFSISVKDNGIGIAAEEQPFIFDTFYRSGTKTNTIGHGIGLTLVKSFTELMQGKILLDSSPGVGSTFSIIFKKGKEHFTDVIIDEPAHDVSPDQQPDYIPDSSEMTDDALTVKGTSVLVVEDNQQLREYIVTVLGDQFTLTQVANGQEALDYLESHLPDLIISDIMMPVMDGITFCKKVKAAMLTSHIPIILLTAKTDVDTKIEGFELGIDDYIEKPFNPRLLRIRVSTLLKNREAVKRWASDGVLKAADTLKIGQADRDFLSKVNKRVHEQLANPEFSIEKLGNELGMSRSTFYRKFKSLTGVSANDYLIKTRLNRAKALLEEGNIAVGQICFEVGFQSPSHLRDSFRKEFNITPSDYQKQFLRSR